MQYLKKHGLTLVFEAGLEPVQRYYIPGSQVVEVNSPPPGRDHSYSYVHTDREHTVEFTVGKTQAGHGSVDVWSGAYYLTTIDCYVDVVPGDILRLRYGGPNRTFRVATEKLRVLGMEVEPVISENW